VIASRPLDSHATFLLAPQHQQLYRLLVGGGGGELSRTLTVPEVSPSLAISTLGGSVLGWLLATASPSPAADSA
jgi:hypothetical protein